MDPRMFLVVAILVIIGYVWFCILRMMDNLKSFDQRMQDWVDWNNGEDGNEKTR